MCNCIHYLSRNGSRLPAPGSRLPALGSRLSALGSRLSALGSRLSALGSLDRLNSVTFSSLNVLYSYINLVILDFLHSVEIAFFLFSLSLSLSLSLSFFYSFLFFPCVHLCFSFLVDL